MLRAKFHVVSSHVSVFTKAILMLSYLPLAVPLKMSLTRKNENMVNLKSASFVILKL